MKVSYDTLKEFYESTFHDVLNYFACNCKDISECRSLIFETYMAYILRKRSKSSYDKANLMTIAKERNIGYIHVEDNEVYIEQPSKDKIQYTAEDIETIKKQIFISLVKSIRKNKNTYRQHRVFAFLSLLVCMLLAIYILKLRYFNDEDMYYIYDIQLVDNKIYFSDTHLKYVDISKKRGKSHSTGISDINMFHVMGETVIYSNYYGIFVSKLSGKENRELLFLNGEVKGSMLDDFIEYGENVYCNVFYNKDGNRYYSICCYNMRDKTFKSIYLKQYPKNEFISLLGILNDTIYFFEKNTIKALSIKTGSVTNVIEVTNAIISNASIDGKDNYIYIIAAYERRKEFDVYFKYSLIKYSLTGEELYRSEEFDNKGYMQISNKGELFFDSDDILYKMSIESELSIVFDFNKYNKASYKVYFLDDYICFLDRFYEKYYLCVINGNGKAARYYIFNKMGEKDYEVLF